MSEVRRGFDPMQISTQESSPHFGGLFLLSIGIARCVGSFAPQGPWFHYSRYLSVRVCEHVAWLPAALIEPNFIMLPG